MKKIIPAALVIVSIMLWACNSGSSASESNSSSTTAAGSKESNELYFDFTVDGKEMHIKPADVTGSYYVTAKSKTFKIFAGNEGTQVLLTIPHDMTQPSSTPSGSTNYDEEITQGSVSLQDYPEKGYTSNSFNTTYPEMSVPVPDAVVITSTVAEGDKARIITGTFNAKTFGSHSGTDPKDVDHVVKGKFRIRHEFTSTNGGAF